MRIEDQWAFQHPERLQLFSMNTPNGIKVAWALEELEVPYEAHLIHIGRGDQHSDAFKSISPNGKIPAIVDLDGPGGERLELSESGAILIHLADKTGRLLSRRPVERLETLQWVFFQVGHVGPMFGQFGHFHRVARESCPHPYPLERYRKETQRLLGVLEERLGDGRAFVMGDELSIADLAIVPWVECLTGFYRAGDMLGFDGLPRVAAWVARSTERPAFQRGRTVCAPKG